MELKGMAINFLGDSITEGSGASEVSKRFTDILAREEEIIAFNYGIGGTRIAHQKNPSENPRHDLDFCSRVAELEPSADMVVVFGGTNDYGHGDAPLGNFNDRTNETFYGALHVLYRSLIEKFPGKPIVVLTPLHRVNEQDKKGDAKKAEVAALAEYVEIIREVAEYYSLPVLDLFKTSGLQPDVDIIRENFMPDGLHPNDAGYEILAQKIGTFLKSL